MQTNLAEKWRSAFLQVVQQPTHAQALQTAGEQKQLKEWTTALTAVVVSACQTLGWQASAKGYSLELLPVPTNEFLTICNLKVSTYILNSVQVFNDDPQIYLCVHELQTFR